MITLAQINQAEEKNKAMILECHKALKDFKLEATGVLPLTNQKGEQVIIVQTEYSYFKKGSMGEFDFYKCYDSVCALIPIHRS